MKLSCQMSFAVFLLCAVLGSCNDQNELQVVSRANNAFGTRIYQILRRRPGNFFFSPLSVETVLALAWVGSRGETERQMATGLQLPLEKQKVAAGFKSLLTHLQSLNREVTLQMANKIFSKQDARIYEAFKAIARRNFLAESEEVNFQRPNEAARIINKWVEQKTRNKITNLISPDSLTANTLMVLVNAIYFKGKWLYQFQPQDTKPRHFHLDSKSVKEVPMMHMLGEFPYAEIPELKIKALQLPYMGDHLSMVILLPDEDSGLSLVESRLDENVHRQIVDLLSTTEVYVSLPRYKMETTSELNEPLHELGMSAMFGATANFSGIANDNLAISRVVQKAFIEVTEEGSEAAAASGVQIVALSGANNPSRPKHFAADHPFMFIIQDDNTGLILFAGRLSSP